MTFPMDDVTGVGPPAMAVGVTAHVWSWEEFLTHKHYHYFKE